MKAKGEEGNTPLHTAASCERAEVFELLLNAGADVKDKNDAGEDVFAVAAAKNCRARGTPLHLAATHGHADIVALLLDQGADPDTGDEYGVTPLYLAAQNDHRDVVTLLLERGADPTIDDEYGDDTPLHWAATRGYTDIVTMLLDRRVGVDDEDEELQTSLHRNCDCINMLQCYYINNYSIL